MYYYGIKKYNLLRRWKNKNITGLIIIMISKITGYSGFRPYGELPYPTLKQGK